MTWLTACVCRSRPRLRGDMRRRFRFLGEPRRGWTGRNDGGRTGSGRSRVITVAGHHPLVELKAIFAHRELNFVDARFFDVQVDLVRLAAVLFCRALLALPTPRSFAQSIQIWKCSGLS